MNLADLPPALSTSPLAPFLHAVNLGIGRWMTALVDRAIRRERAAAHGPASSARALELLQQRRLELVQALATALREEMHGGPGRLVTDAAAAHASSTLELALIPEVQLDVETDAARFVGQVEAEAHTALLQLAELTSRLLGVPGADRTTVPLDPATCARALCQGVRAVVPEEGPRAELLHVLGASLGGQMIAVYSELTHWLQQRGEELVLDWLAHAAEEPAPPEESMRELVAWARRTQPTPLDAQDGGSALHLQLRVQPHPPADADPPSRSAAEDLMRRLVEELRRRTARSSSMTGLLMRLERLAQRLAVDDPRIWVEPSHPWWQLLDRLLGAAAVRDDVSTKDRQALGRSLDGVMQRLLQSPRLDARACLSAADDVQRLTSQVLKTSVAPGPDEVAELQREADREELELTFRSQIVQQLRSTPTSTQMRRFLVDPWTRVMVALALRHGATSEAVSAAALVVDDLIRVTAVPGKKVSRSQRAVLLRQVGEGLLVTGMSQSLIDSELVALSEILRNPPEHPTDPAQAWQEEPVPALPLPVLLDLHAGLPTVPMGGAASELATTPSQWLASLQPGVLCRLFLQGIWMTARLNWVDPGRRLFLFQSRHGGRSHTLTQRMLCRLREAGLATSIEDNLLRAQAMDSLVRSNLD